MTRIVAVTIALVALCITGDSLHGQTTPMSVETAKVVSKTLDKTVTGKDTLKYDLDEWRRLCKHPHLRSPALCLVESGDAGSRAKQE